jgi:hypothetical protein
MHLPTHGAETCSDLWFLVRGDMDLQVGQRVKVIELLPMLS